MSLELLDFPPELVVKIMHMLSLPDLMACKRTNRLLHTLVQETLSLQYLVETHAAGVEQDLKLDITLPERLAALKTSNEYWSTFNFKHKKTISTEPFPGLFDLANGIFLHAKLDLLSMCSPEAIRFIFLPSFIQPTKEVQWHAMDVNRKIIGWTSPLQVHDLIAFTTTFVRLLVRSASFCLPSYDQHSSRRQWNRSTRGNHFDALLHRCIPYSCYPTDNPRRRIFSYSWIQQNGYLRGHISIIGLPGIHARKSRLAVFARMAIWHLQRGESNFIRHLRYSELCCQEIQCFAIDLWGLPTFISKYFCRRQQNRLVSQPLFLRRRSRRRQSRAMPCRPGASSNQRWL